MEPSSTTTLFSELPASRRGPSAFLISIFFHGVAISLIYLGLKHSARLEAGPTIERYTVRLLKLHTTDLRPRWSSYGGPAAPGSQSVKSAPSAGAPAAASVPRELAQLLPAPQTLVQPDLPPNLLLPHETPIPLVLMWTANTPVRKIVPPPLQKTATPDARPSLTAPNHELNLADLKVSATAFATELPALPPSNTTPLRVHGPQPVKQVPQTASMPSIQPAPATVMSLSDLRMPEGTIALPLANQTAQAGSAGTLATNRNHDAPQPGNSTPDSKQAGTGTSPNAGNQGDKVRAPRGSTGQNGAGDNGQSGARGGGQGNKAGQIGSGRGIEIAGDNDGGAGLSNVPSTTHIRLREDGQFGVVVVGSSATDEYPEMSGIWSGRLAYTVYLHVGLTRNWILQYSLPRDAQTSVAGNVTRPDAPWPYDMIRPNLTPADYNADAIMVHGFVNVSGHFEKLAIVFPPQFAQAKFVLNALQEWQFRPALQSGSLTTVEVLLIIPEEVD